MPEQPDAFDLVRAPAAGSVVQTTGTRMPSTSLRHRGFRSGTGCLRLRSGTGWFRSGIGCLRLRSGTGWYCSDAGDFCSGTGDSAQAPDAFDFAQAPGSIVQTLGISVQAPGSIVQAPGRSARMFYKPRIVVPGG